MKTYRYLIAVCLIVIGSTGLPAARADIALQSATIGDLQRAMASGALTAEEITSRYLARIAAFDKRGPAINAVITLNPRALEDARVLDRERRAGVVRGALHGIPIVLKDNFNTRDLPTTAGCTILAGSIPANDAFVVAKLRAAGVILLAKVNMDELAANGGAPNGYSSLGGQTRNPHDPSRSPGGSSAGTGAAIAAAFAQFGLGTDTSLSVRGPASFNGVVALRPTAGLLSRDGIVPLALSFDAVGPMARNVYDVAVALGAMTGSDAADPTTKIAERYARKDYYRDLKPGGLKRARIGIVRVLSGQNAETDRVFSEAIAKLRSLGVDFTDPVEIPSFVVNAKSSLYMTVRTVEFAIQIDAYLASLQPAHPHTLRELVARAEAAGSEYRNQPKLRSLRQNLSAPGPDDPIYLAAANEGRAMMRAAVDALFRKHRLDAIVFPTLPWPAGAVDALPRKLSESLLDLVPQIGFPELVVPAGYTSDGLPVTISFVGRPFSEPLLFSYAYDFERASVVRPLPRHTPALPRETIALRARRAGRDDPNQRR